MSGHLQDVRQRINTASVNAIFHRTILHQEVLAETEETRENEGKSNKSRLLPASMRNRFQKDSGNRWDVLVQDITSYINPMAHVA